MNRDQQKAMFAGKKKDANSNRIAYDIFLYDNVKIGNILILENTLQRLQITQTVIQKNN